MRTRRHRGQVIVMALLALLLLGGMVFYTFNLGDQVNRKILTQDAADSAAIGGAVWMARSMNVVAMNNVAQTRLITMVPVLDSLPEATKMTYEELTALLNGLDGQLQRGLGGDPFLAQGVRGMSEDFRREQAILQPLYDALVASGYDVRPTTFYNAPGGGQGTLWEGTLALEDFSRAAVDTSGVLTQANAASLGLSCLLHNPDAPRPTEDLASYIAPVLPQMPAKEGVFSDFNKPIEEGRPPEYYAYGMGDHIRRGPYDQLFHWRDEVRDQGQPAVREEVSRVWVQAVNGNPRNQQGKPGLSPGAPGGNQGHWDVTYRTIKPGVPGPQIGWKTYGVYSWSVIRGNDVPSSGLAHYANYHLPDLPENIYSRIPGGDRPAPNFLRRLQYLSRTKLDYIWGSTQAKTIHYPNWVTDYPAAKNIGEKTPGQVKFTWVWILRTRSSLAPTAGGYRTAGGTFQTNGDDPYSCPVLAGWVDPADPKNVALFGNAVQVAEWVWQADWTYEVQYDETIGLPAPKGPLPPGTVLPWHTVYVRDQFVFFGADTGDEVAVRNPANWSAGDRKPIPFLLDVPNCDYRSNGERRYLSFLGVARYTNTPEIWAGRFEGTNPNPYRNVLSLAEAHVFNNQSWDLWTQDWQARLRPIDQWEQWVGERMEAAPGEMAAVAQWVPANDFYRTRAVLRAYDPQMVKYVLTH